MPAVVVRVWGFWPSVENYIVDASILDSTSSDVGSQDS